MVQSAQLSGGRASRSAAALTVALISLVLGGWVLIWNDDGGGPFPVVLIHNGRASVPYLLTLVALAANLAHRASTPARWIAAASAGGAALAMLLYSLLLLDNAGTINEAPLTAEGSSRCGQRGDTSGEWTTHRSRSHLLHCRVRASQECAFSWRHYSRYRRLYAYGEETCLRRTALARSRTMTRAALPLRTTPSAAPAAHCRAAHPDQRVLEGSGPFEPPAGYWNRLRAITLDRTSSDAAAHRAPRPGRHRSVADAPRRPCRRSLFGLVGVSGSADVVSALPRTEASRVGPWAGWQRLHRRPGGRPTRHPLRFRQRPRASRTDLPAAQREGPPEALRDVRGRPTS